MGRSRVLDSESDLKFHRREWVIQRIGWVAVALFLAAAFAGLFGGGPLSHARADGPAGNIEYERFVRSGASSDLIVTPAHADPSGLHRVEITAEFLEAFRIESITPEPAAVRMTGQQLVYEFVATAPGASIAFHIHPQRLWRHSAALRIDGGEPLEISQLTYP